jgi:hypothetical protein
VVNPNNKIVTVEVLHNPYSDTAKIINVGTTLDISRKTTEVKVESTTGATKTTTNNQTLIK